MITQKIARRPLAIGPFALKAGDVLTDEAEACLPAGRLKVMMARGDFIERPVGGEDDRVAALESRVAELEAKLASHRHAGRPPKED